MAHGYKQYIFEVTVREKVIARSEEEARRVLPSQMEGTLSDWTLVNVVEDA